jgi:nicotinic acid phosphoribosyltransferase
VASQTEKEAVFNLYFRKNPFGGGFTVACGLTNVIGFINNFGFTEKDWPTCKRSPVAMKSSCLTLVY